MNLDAAETPLLDAAETPLEADAAEWLEHARLRLALKQDQVKHNVVHMRLAADWLSYPLHLDVNELLHVSVNGGEWHGTADCFTDGEGRGCWNLTFHYKVDTSLMKTTVYHQIRDTSTYLSVESTASNQWDSMLALKNA